MAHEEFDLLAWRSGMRRSVEREAVKTSLQRIWDTVDEVFERYGLCPEEEMNLNAKGHRR
jgi:hypothetical protein